MIYFIFAESEKIILKNRKWRSMTEKTVLPANVRLNDDTAYVEKLRKVMAGNGGYCPCRIQRTEDNICICTEFRGQIADPDFEGFCHCKLYYKEK